MSHLIEMSNITTRANNQFPRPDFHRLDKQPYRLQPFFKGEWLGLPADLCFLLSILSCWRIESVSLVFFVPLWSVPRL